MFRSVKLPADIPGMLYLHGMPGRNEDWERFTVAVRKAGIGRIVSFTPDDEIARESPLYAAAIADGSLPCRREAFPIPDYGIPDDREGYAGFVAGIADLLRRGEGVLIHCGAGVGRTGTFAVCLIIALGASGAEAREAVGLAGSHPETGGQEDLIAWYEGFGRRSPNG